MSNRSTCLQTVDWNYYMTALVTRAGPYIGANGIAVYAALAVGPQATPSYQQLAQLVGISRRTAIRTIHTLEQYNLIAVERSPEQHRQHQGNRYHFTDPTEWRLPQRAERSDDEHQK